MQMLHQRGQQLALNDCVYRLTYDSKYLLVHDVDEFVVPTVAKDWSSMLDAISARNSAITRDRIASYNFRNRFFPLEYPDIIDEVFRVQSTANVQARNAFMLLICEHRRVSVLQMSCYYDSSLLGTQHNLE